jgi:protein-S-isoprenylcysteine O-methyltransferase Ste14
VSPHVFAGRVIQGAWAGFLIVWLAAALDTKRTERRFSGPTRLGSVMLVVSGSLLLIFSEAGVGFLGHELFPHNNLVDLAAALFTVTGIVIAFIARFFLGRNWSSEVTVKAGHELIMSGPYRYVRHPIYSGLLFSMVGTALFLREVRGFVGVLLATAGWKLKSLAEEKLMTEQFGRAYIAYKQRVKALIPFVW